MRQNKYSKLSSEPIRPITSDDPPLVQFFKQDDKRPQKIDLTFWVNDTNPKPQMAKACAEIFWLATQGYASDTRLSFRNNLLIFHTFLDWRAKKDSRKQINSTLELGPSIFIEFLAYLSTKYEKKERTLASRYHYVTRFFKLMQINRPQYLPENFKIPPGISLQNVEHSRTENVISLKDLKLIEDAALKEVKQIRADHRLALDLLESVPSIDKQARMRRKPAGFWKPLANALYYMIQVEGIRTTSNMTALSMKNNSHPAPNKVLGWYAPTSENYFIPFLVLIYLRTAINVTSIFKLKRDCLAEHPLPLGLTICKFTKPRAGSRSNKELSFPTNQPNGAIDLIQFLLKYTQPWIEHTSETEKDSLFLYRCRISGVRSAGRCFTDKGLSQFIERNNLPPFSWSQLRPSIATLLYLRTRDIFRVQRLLDHTRVTTTIKYIRGAIVRAQHNKEMSEGIDQMGEAVTSIKKSDNDISIFVQPAAEVIAAKVEAGELAPEAGERILKGGCRTLLGRCRDPLNSPQPGEIKGRVCRSLHACIFCENCWIFAEDLPQTIKYRNELEAEKTEMTSEVWDALHGEAVREINESILPSFSPEAVAKAESEAKQMHSSIM